MKTCPKCHEILGNDAEICFNCQYDFNYKRVLSPEELSARRNRETQRTQEFIELQDILEQQKEEQLKKNPYYEYEVVTVDDLSNGRIDDIRLGNIIKEYARKGWRLHTVFSNELGKRSSMTTVGSIGVGTNSTVDQTVLIFERCIRA